CQEYKSLFTF
nr:immunoglobulin light chain junction region [Macaca mulatta]MOX99281.1 immunoglobulin light chain junction region [Macaca mulatta]